MKTSAKCQNGTAYSVAIEIAPEEYVADCEQQMKSYAKNQQLKGFRKNAIAAHNFVRQRYGTVTRKEIILQKTCQQVYNYIDEHRLMVVGEIALEKSFSKIDWGKNTVFSIVYTFEASPIADVSLDKTIKIENYKVTALDPEYLEDYIMHVRKVYANREVVEEVQESDTLYVTEKDNKPSSNATHCFRLRVTHSLAKKLPIIGKKTNDIIHVSAAIINEFPHAFAPIADSEKQSGSNLEIHYITRTKPVPLDQAFFDKALGKDTATSQEEFHEKIRESALVEAQSIADDIVCYNIKKCLIKLASATLAKEHQDKKELIWQTLAEKYIRDFKIKVDDAQVIKKLIYYNTLFVAGPNRTPEEITAVVKENVKKDLQNRQNPQGKYLIIRNYLLEEALLTLIKKRIFMQEKAIDTVELEKIGQKYLQK